MLRVVAAYIERDGYCLLAQRPDEKPQSGYWEFPGGKVEVGESDAHALRRELREELSVGALVREYLTSNAHRYSDELSVVVHLYRVVLDAEPVALEHQALRWVLPRTIDLCELCRADRPLAEFIKRLNK